MGKRYNQSELPLFEEGERHIDEVHTQVKVCVPGKMQKKRKPRGHHTKEQKHKDTLVFQLELPLGEETKYKKIGENKEKNSHLQKKKSMPSGYWTKERCRKEALKFNKRIDFAKSSPVAYYKSLRMKWIDGWQWLAWSHNTRTDSQLLEMAKLYSKRGRGHYKRNKHLYMQL